MNVELDDLLKRRAAAKAALAEVDSEGIYTPSVPGPPASRDALDALRRRLPDLPESYVALLARVDGWTAFHDMTDLSL